MGKKSIQAILRTDGYINVSRILILAFDSLVTASYLSELITIDSYFNTEDGVFFVSSREMQNRLKIGKDLQTKIRNQLKRENLLHTELKGKPAITHYKIDYEEVEKLYLKVADISTLVCGYPQTVSLLYKDINKQSTKNVLCSNTQKGDNKIRRAGISKQHAKSLIKKDPKILVPNTKYKQFIDYWNKSGLRTHHNPSTKTYEQAIQDIKEFCNGILFNGIHYLERWDRPYTFEEFQLAVDNFAQEAIDKRIYPKNKAYHLSIGLSRFLFDPHSKKEIQSPFLNCHLNPPKIIAGKCLVIDPKLVEFLNKLVTTNIGTMSDLDHYHIIRLANSWNEILSKNKNKIKDRLFLKYPKRQADFIWEVVLSHYNSYSEPLTPFRMASPVISEKLAYRVKTGILLT